MDERYLAVLVKNKVGRLISEKMMVIFMMKKLMLKMVIMVLQGLVVFSACSHAGIVNVMESATKELKQK